MRQAKYPVALMLVGCGALGGAVLVVFTPWGLGLSPDSAVYIGGARGLVQGNGVSLPTESGGFAPIVHYPPLYPALLASLGVVGLDPFKAARWLNAFFFATNIFLVGWLVFVATRAVGLAVCASALMMTSFPVVQAHTMAWSEPLFIFFELSGSLFLFFYLQQGSYRNLVASSLAVGLSAISRYAGIAFLMSGSISVLLLSHKTGKRRVGDAAVFLMLAAIPILFWTGRNWFFSGSVVNRSVSVHLMGWEHLGAIFVTVLSWFSIPLFDLTEGQSLLLGWIALSVLGVWLWIWHRSREPEVAASQTSVVLAAMMLAILIAYISVLSVTISFLDYQTPIDSRILAPGYPALMLLGVSLVGIFVRPRTMGNQNQWILCAIAFIFLTLQATSTWPWLIFSYREGVGYASRHWAASEVVQRIKVIEPSTALFSNAPDVLFTLLGRPAGMIPRKVNPDSRAENQQFYSQLAQMKHDMKMSNGVLVYFDRVAWRWYLPERKELETAMGLRLIFAGNDGAIYRVD